MTGNERPINLQAIARETLQRFGFLVDFPPGALQEVGRLAEPDFSRLQCLDLTAWLWSSIDNDESRDLDQIEYIRSEPRGTRLSVAIADVVSFVERGTALDKAAWHNTTSLYTGVRTFPMLPDKLSTDLTSLVEGEERLAIVIEALITSDGSLAEPTVYRAKVRNQAQLTYHAVAAWLENQPGNGSPVTERMLAKIRANPALQEQLGRQNELAQALRQRRLEAGALTFETIELRPELAPGDRWELKAAAANAATRLIEDFMITANQAVISFLQSKRFPTVRRVVRTPKNWPQIVTLAAQHGGTLPAEPEAKALEDFLTRQRQKDPDQFPHLSLAIIKLLGRGEYTVAAPGGEAPGHFALAVEGYTHSTAPNRRYPDVLTQRLLEAALGGSNPPYSMPELAELADHCTQKETDANKAERSVQKSVAAVVLAPHIGEKFEGFITGAADKGIWVRLLHPPIEGRVEGAPKGVAVGDRVLVELLDTDPWRGYIDFRLIERHGTAHRGQ
jgi:VacB/RNase II family 3'-5' exoribonuclease